MCCVNLLFGIMPTSDMLSIIMLSV
jgi:hypothetical protein